MKDLCQHSLIFFVVTVLGYFAAAGSLYWALYLRGDSKFALVAKIASQNGSSVAAEGIYRTAKASTAKTVLSGGAIADIWSAIRSDVTLSVLSSAIFAVCAALMTAAYKLGYTRLYLQPQQYGLWYLAFSLVLVVVLQDAYFYFTHRLSHHPKCYKWLHSGHHYSKNPTPWTAFAFDPAEAMIQSIYLIGITMLIPMHLSVLVALVMVMTMGALIHHFGVRLFADSALGRWLGSWMVGCTHHWLHHRKYTVHYSLYFTFWDRVMGTQYAGYEDVLSPKADVVKLAPASKRKAIPFPVPFKKAS